MELVYFFLLLLLYDLIFLTYLAKSSFIFFIVFGNFDYQLLIKFFEVVIILTHIPHDLISSYPFALVLNITLNLKSVNFRLCHHKLLLQIQDLFSLLQIRYSIYFLITHRMRAIKHSYFCIFFTEFAIIYFVVLRIIIVYLYCFFLWLLLNCLFLLVFFLWLIMVIIFKDLFENAHFTKGLVNIII